MDVIRLLLLGVYILVMIWLVYAPVELGIQSLHLHNQGKPIRALIAIGAGWLLSVLMFFLGYSFGVERILG